MKNKVIVAFPGCGKTSTVKALIRTGYKAMDFDIKGLKGKRCNKDLNTNFILGYLQEGYTIFLHNGAINFYKLSRDTEVKLFVPCYGCKDAWVKRLKKRGDGYIFLHEVMRNWCEWIDDYIDLYAQLRACGYNVSIHCLDEHEYIGAFLGTVHVTRI